MASALPAYLTTPRPNGSHTLARAVEAVRSRLEEQGVEVQAQAFVLRPYYMELLGLWLALSGLLLPVAALGRWGWWGLALALATVAVPVLEIRYLRPVVSGLVRQPACNLEARFPAARPRQELIFCAHLDSKTEPLDHFQREVLLRLGRVAMVLALASGALMVAGRLADPGSARTAAGWFALLCALPATSYGLAMGVNLVGGRFSRRPSSGSVDNGAAVAVLVYLAGRLQRGEVRLEYTEVRLLFTVGEEAGMQGALACVRDRAEWQLPCRAVNLEVLGQDGGYLLWERDGSAMEGWDNDAGLNLALERVVEAVTGEQPRRAPALNSDAFAFLRQGIPAATLGSYDQALEGRGYHSALDHPGRVHPGRLEEAVEILGELAARLDAQPGTPAR
jgi:hypothetical protein